MTENKTEIFGHPKGLFLLFGAELWERFSFYALRAVLVLYLTALTVDGGLGWEKADALRLYGIYTGLVYLTPLIGGWIADNVTGRRKAVLAGAVLMAAGQFALFLAPFSPDASLYAGLTLLICGNGLFKPNISTMVGDLYAPDDLRRDSAFTIFYMGINIGSFLAGLAAGVLTGDGSFRPVFAAAGCGMLVALFLQLFLSNRYLGTAGLRPAAKSQDRSGRKRLTKAEFKRLRVISVLGLFTVVFWAGFEQAGGLLNLFAANQTDRVVGGYTVPAAFFQSLNPLFIVILAPLFAWFWVRLGDRDPSFTAKFVFALLFLGAGFLFMLCAVNQAERTGAASPLWLAALYLCHTAGELCLSPTGLSVVSKLAPARCLSLMMGVWFCFAALANFIAGFVGSLAEDMGTGAVFAALAGTAFAAAAVLWAVSGKLMKDAA